VSMLKPGWMAQCASVWAVLMAVSSGGAQATTDHQRLMRGAPPPAELQVTRANWLQAPYSTWAFRHLDQLIPVAAVDRGELGPSLLGPLWLDLERYRFAAPDGRVRSFDEVSTEQRFDALLVWHDGSLRLERYHNGHTARTRHALLTASGAFTGLLAEMLIAEKRFDDMRRVTFYLPELRGTAWEDASVRETMDMEVAIDFREIYDDPWSDFGQLLQAAGMLAAPEGGRVFSALHAFLPTLRAAGEPGMDFQLAAANIEVLGWIMHRVTGQSVAELFEQRLYQHIGAERDAYFATDPAGMTVAGAGLGLSARDLLRLGIMLAQGGHLNGRQIVAPDVIRRIETGGNRKRGLLGNDEAPFHSYRSHWYIHHPTHTYAAWGIHGQHLFIAPRERVVMVVLSSHPQADGAYTAVTEAFFHSMVRYLQEGH